MKKIVAFLLALSMVLAMAACGSQAPAATTEAPKTDAPAGETTAAPAETEAPENLTETQKIIKEAEGMTLEELAKKAIEESNGKMFYGVGNSSRGKSALPLFIAYLQTIDPATIWSSSGSSPKTTRSSIS